MYLQVKKVGDGSWIFRFGRNGVEKWMGLGSAHDVTLAEARAKAAECRKLLAAGKDPFAERKASRAAAKQAMTFKETMNAFVNGVSVGLVCAPDAARFADSIMPAGFITYSELSLSSDDF